MKWPLCWTLIVLTLALSQRAAAQPAASEEVIVFRLKSIDPLAIEPILNQLFAGELKIAAQNRGSLGKELIVRGPRKAIEQITELLQVIDTPAPTGREASAMRGSGPMGGDMYGEGYGTMPGYARPQRASRDKLKQEYEALEQKAAELAQELRNTQGSSPRENGSNDALRKTVADAFAARQRLHQAELAALEARLKATRETLSARERIKDAIIDRRVDDLLNPALRWDAPAAAAGQAGRRDADVAAPPTLPRDPYAAPSGVVVGANDKLVEFSLGADDGIRPQQLLYVYRGDQYIGQLEVVHVQPDRSVARIKQASQPMQINDRVVTAQGWPGKSLGNRTPEEEGAATVSAPPRAAPPTTTSGAEAVSDALILHTPEEIQERLSKLDALVTTWKRAVTNYQNQLNSGEGNPDNLRTLVEDAERQRRSWQNKLDVAVSQHKAQIRLLELNLEEAEAKLRAADQSLKRVQALHDANSVSQAEFDENKLQFDRAKHDVERARTLLELYQNIRYEADPDENEKAKPAEAVRRSR